jgi:hypothetical protein
MFQAKYLHWYRPFIHLLDKTLGRVTTVCRSPGKVSKLLRTALPLWPMKGFSYEEYAASSSDCETFAAVFFFPVPMMAKNRYGGRQLSSDSRILRVKGLKVTESHSTGTAESKPHSATPSAATQRRTRVLIKHVTPLRHRQLPPSMSRHVTTHQHSAPAPRDPRRPRRHGHAHDLDADARAVSSSSSSTVQSLRRRRNPLPPLRPFARDDAARSDPAHDLDRSQRAL